MRLFALSDPHLSFHTPKPMDIFGAAWRDHAERIEANWRADVSAEDTVIIAGDISWALTLAEALPDLAWIDRLPGRKILLRGNHDYWWSTVRKMNQVVRERGLTTLTFLRYEALRLDEHLLLIGSRGWNPPGEWDDPKRDEPIYERELARFDLAFSSAEKQRRPGDILLAAVHYSPLTRRFGSTPLSERLEAYGVRLCIYGHVHGAEQGSLSRRSIEYRLTAADYLHFKPLLLAENGQLCL